MSKFRPLVISGPSGCGKSTLIKKLMADYPNMFGFSVSHTTRQPRPGEADGVDYHFTDLDTMKKRVSNGEFLESATFSNNMYGTSKQAVKDVLNEGKICILDVDSQGVKSIKKTDLDCLLVFVKPPSMEELGKRLRGRGTEQEDAIQKRLSTCRGEMEYAEQPGSYRHTIVNDTVDKAYEELRKILKNSMNIFQ